MKSPERAAVALPVGSSGVVDKFFTADMLAGLLDTAIFYFMAVYQSRLHFRLRPDHLLNLGIVCAKFWCRRGFALSYVVATFSLELETCNCRQSQMRAVATGGLRYLRHRSKRRHELCSQ